MKLTIFDIRYTLKEKCETIRVATPTLKDAIEVAEELGVPLEKMTNIQNTQTYIHGVRVSPPEPPTE